MIKLIWPFLKVKKNVISEIQTHEHFVRFFILSKCLKLLGYIILLCKRIFKIYYLATLFINLLVNAKLFFDESRPIEHSDTAPLLTALQKYYQYNISLI